MWVRNEGGRAHLWRPVYFLRFCWVQGTGQPREKPQRIETRTSASRCLQAGRQASHRKNPSLVRDGLLRGESVGEDSLAHGKVIEHLLHARPYVRYFINTVSFNPDKSVEMGIIIISIFQMRK